MSAKNLEQMLADSTKQHHHLCPRQVSGARMGILAGKILQLNLPQTDKRLVTIVETDGCMVDGVSAATNCTVGHRTLRVEDEGKIAATFVDTVTKRAIRIAPRAGIRRVAQEYSSADCSRWEAQLKAYQCMPDDDLFIVKDVELLFSIEKLISRKGKKAICQRCEEEINNEREVMSGETVLCRSCVGQGYYRRPTQSGENKTLHKVVNINDSRITGAILAGGKSQRMGKDKGLLTINGTTFIEHLARGLQSVFDDVMIISDHADRYRFLRLPMYPDLLKDCGPLGGIHSALVNAGRGSVFFLPCDMPLIEPDIIRYIVSCASPRFDVSVASFQNRVIPLLGIYRRSCLESLERVLQHGEFRVQAVLGTWKTELVKLDDTPFLGLESQLSNVNTQQHREKLLGRQSFLSS